LSHIILRKELHTAISLGKGKGSMLFIVVGVVPERLLTVLLITAKKLSHFPYKKFYSSSDEVPSKGVGNDRVLRTDCGRRRGRFQKSF